MKKIFLILLLFLISSFLLFNFSFLKNELVKKYPNLRFTKFYFKKEPLMNKINNDYNVKFLPDTEFVRLEFVKKKLKFKKEYYTGGSDPKSINYSLWGTFFFEVYEKNLIVADYLANFYYIDKNLLDNTNNVNLKSVESNLKAKRLHDIHVNKNIIYVSYVKKINNCQEAFVDYAEINLKKIEFKNLIKSDECNETGVFGKIKHFIHENKEGILVTTSSGEYNNPDQNSQKLDSIFGKIIFVDIAKKNYFFYSMGHRVIQGLYTDNKNIIATEHGPRGGDEINKIIYKKNYGWPIASYGEKYDFKYENDFFYKKSHYLYDFEEPVFYFIPSIGINEIIKIDDNFSNFLKNKFIIASLNGRSIFFSSFNHDYSSLTSFEKVFLNERVRDLLYLSENKTILLALEENGEIGIIKLKKINEK